MNSSGTNSTQWDEKLLRDPHGAADKRGRVRRMFAAIAPSYDLNNRLHSLWQDQRWRRKAVKLAGLKPDDVVVDVACGTGDLTLAFAEQLALIGDIEALPMHVVGIDFTFEMLPLAIQKWMNHPLLTEHAGESFYKPEVRRIAQFVNGDAMALPLPDACCDVVSIAFGIRNVVDPLKAMQEFRRILRPGGRVIVLEFSLPKNGLLRGLYNFYFRKVLPHTATWIARDRTGAYKYLPESVNTFIGREEMMRMISAAGFERVEQHPFTFGICVCYRGVVADAPVSRI